MPVYPILLIIAFLYSTVGHGGGSGYLAVFHLLGVEPYLASSTALILNLMVSSLAFFNYRRFFKLREIIPFVVFSVPLAYLGGSLHLPGEIIRKITGIVILLVGIRMFLKIPTTLGFKSLNPYLRFIISAFVGGGLGFLAGIIGIGGGIFLSPVLIFFGFDPKTTASLSAFFILINSTSGLVARLGFVDIDIKFVILSLISVFIGGFAGSYLGSYRFQSNTIKILLGVVLAVAGIKLLL